MRNFGTRHGNGHDSAFLHLGGADIDDLLSGSGVGGLFNDLSPLDMLHGRDAIVADVRRQLETKGADPSEIDGVIRDLGELPDDIVGKPIVKGDRRPYIVEIYVAADMMDPNTVQKMKASRLGAPDLGTLLASIISGKRPGKAGGPEDLVEAFLGKTAPRARAGSAPDPFAGMGRRSFDSAGMRGMPDLDRALDRLRRATTTSQSAEKEIYDTMHMSVSKLLAKALPLAPLLLIFFPVLASELWAFVKDGSDANRTKASEGCLELAEHLEDVQASDIARFTKVHRGLVDCDGSLHRIRDMARAFVRNPVPEKAKALALELGKSTPPMLCLINEATAAAKKAKQEASDAMRI